MPVKRQLFREFLRFLEMINSKNPTDTEFITTLPCGLKIMIKVEASKRKLKLVKIG